MNLRSDRLWLRLLPLDESDDEVDVRACLICWGIVATVLATGVGFVWLLA